MKLKSFIYATPLFFLLLIVVGIVTLQTEAGTNWAISKVENIASSEPERAVRIYNVEGLFSSKPKIGLITIADRDGIWLSLKNVSMSWTRLALLKFAFAVNELKADEIDIARAPLSEQTTKASSSVKFSMPKLPVSIDVDQLDVQKIHFGKDLFGIDAIVSLNGGASLKGDELRTALTVDRLDTQGNINLNALYLDKTGTVKIDFSLSEPENGIIANLLKLEKRPAFNLSLDGNGTLDNLDLQLKAKAEGVVPISGLVTLRQDNAGRNFFATIDGPISHFIPAQYRNYLGDKTTFNATGAYKKNGDIVIEKMTLKSGVFDITGQAEVLKDGFLRRLGLKSTVANNNGGVLTLPGGKIGDNMSVRSINLDVDYGNGNTWQGKIIANDLTMPNFKADNFNIDLSGITENLNNSKKRRLTIVADGKLDNISTNDPKIAQSLNHKLNLAFNADVGPKGRIKINNFAVSAEKFMLSLKGLVNDMVFAGDLKLKADELAPVALFTGMPISGGLDINAKSTVQLKTSMFDLSLNGLAHNIKIGNKKIDHLLDGEMQLTGAVSRNSSGFIAKKIRLDNKKAVLTADGNFSLQSADMKFDFKLSDLSMLDKRASGALNLKGTAQGKDKRINVNLQANAPKNSLMNRDLHDGKVVLNVLLDSSSSEGLSLKGTANGSGSFAGEPLILSGNFEKTPNIMLLNDLKVNIGSARINGTVSRNNIGLLDGVISMHAPDLSTLVAIALMEGKGTMNVDFELKPQNNIQTANIKATAKDVEVANIKINDLDVDGVVQDLFGVPLINGSINASEISASGFMIHSVKGEAQVNGNKTNFQLAANVQDCVIANASGSFNPVSETVKEIQFSSLTVSRGDLSAKLVSPATVSFIDKVINIKNFNFDVGDGKLSLNGSLEDTFAIELDIDRLPLRLANLVKPDLGLDGVLSGSVKLQGTKQNPVIEFDMAGKNLALAQTTKFGISPINLNAKGSTKNNMMALNANIMGDGLKIEVLGKLPMNTIDGMDLDITLDDLPLKFANSFVKDQSVSGDVTGHAKIAGTYLNPTAQFKLNGQSLSALMLSRSGISSVRISAEGTFENKVLELQSFSLLGPKSLNLKASGRVPFIGDGLDLVVNGSTPLLIANQFLATRGAKIDAGSVTVNADIKGSFVQPLLNGGIKIVNANFIDTQTNLKLKNINLDMVFRGDQVVVNSLTAQSSVGGSLSGRGTISIDIAQKLPANLEVNFNSFRYNDGKMLKAVLSGKLTVSKALLQNPEIGGDITIEHAEINVPDNFGAAGLIDVKHKNTTAPIKTTLKRAGLIEEKIAEAEVKEHPSIPQFKLRIRAPNQFFIRGFGLDAEMGGEIGIIGPANDIRPIGAFQMIRGRFNILSKRVTFNEGQVTLVGNFDPQLYFVATAESSDITVTITVSGTIETLKIILSSTPELPQDEILAQLLFNRSISELSPFQLAQLASIAAQMAGLTNTSLLDALRNSTGLDDLDVTTDAKGNTGVKAGRYINENIYLGVETGAGGKTKGTINLDITKSLKTKGAVGADGNSSIGVFYEKDY